jgi:hypothetical protein
MIHPLNNKFHLGTTIVPNEKEFQIANTYTMCLE